MLSRRPESHGQKPSMRCVSVLALKIKGGRRPRILVGVDVLENGRFTSTDYCDTVPLAWSYRSDNDAQSGIDIPKNVVQFLNVLICYEPSVSTGFEPCTCPKTLREASKRFRLPGEFRFRIQVSAHNVETQQFGLRVSWADDWATAWSSEKCEKLRIVHDLTVFNEP